MDRVELFLQLGSLPPLGSFEDETLRKFLVQDRTRRVSKAKLDAFVGATEANLKELNRLLKEYVNAEYRVEDLHVDRDTKLMEEFDLLKGTDLSARMGENGVLEVRVKGFYEE